MVSHPEMIGCLLHDPDKSIYDALQNTAEGQIQCNFFSWCNKDSYFPLQRAIAFTTNDQRMLVALKLCGFETIDISAIRGVERFCY
jgi:hypothetical protein